ncbi:MAG: hypothetical protein K6U03_10630, partial [Firmicutes bacterium]|nr:hypothetical protein [Bacillota bacterium]
GDFDTAPVSAVAPAILLLMTSFTRYVVVLSLARNGLGLPGIPPNQVLIGLALFMTFFTMGPVFSQVNEAAKKWPMKARPLPYYKKGGPRTSSWGGSFMAIPKTSEKKADRLYQIMEYMQYDESAIKVRFQQTDMLPPFAGVWDDPIFKKPDPRFGGQKLGELLTTLAKEMPSVNCGDIFWDVVVNDFNPLFPEMAAKKISVEEGLKKAQESAMKRYEEATKKK